MAFDVTSTFQAGNAGKATDINKNFADIEAELNAFPTAGLLKDGSITNAMIQSGVIATSKLSQVSTSTSFAGASDSVLPTQLAVKSYVDSKEFTSYYNVLQRTADVGLGDSYSKISMTAKIIGGTSYLSNGGYKCPVTGYYQISYYATMKANPHGNVQAKLDVNGVTKCHSYSGGNSSLGQNVRLGGSATLTINKDQYVYCYASATNGRGGTCYDFTLYVTKVA
jgi:hypothetical protein